MLFRSTTAKDQTTKINHTEATKNATIVDTVFYTHLLPGREYTVTGTLMDQATNKPILVNGKEVPLRRPLRLKSLKEVLM